jgi:DNA polymerase II small subunit
LTKLTSISKISGQKQDLSIIGMVSNKRTTKNKNVMLELEDLNKKITVLIHNSKPELIEKSKSIVLDEVIGINGNGNNEIIFAKDIIFPEISGSMKNFSKEEEYAVFTSDIHVGSNKFIEDKFQDFLAWLNGEAGNDEQKELSSKIKYLFLVGDNVDGVGVYPGQVERLHIKDLKEQYKRLAGYIGKIRKDITIFMCPGQHDASRIAEPQTAIEREYAEELYNISNLHLVSNPALVEIARDNGKGIKVLMYHGASFHSIIEDIEDLRMTRAHDNPTRVSKHLLRKRHLAPPHSTTDHMPVPEIDPLIIREVPDVFASGDLHRPDVDFYGPVLLIASSCWQHITEFEEKVGNHPDPCKVPILNLKTGKVNILDFS